MAAAFFVVRPTASGCNKVIIALRTSVVAKNEWVRLKGDGWVPLDMAFLDVYRPKCDQLSYVLSISNLG